MNEKWLASILLTVLVSCPNFLGNITSGENKAQDFAVDGKGIPDMDVMIEVWDSKNETWVKDINAPVLSQLTFRVYVHNVGDYDLFNITIVDHLPPFLTYVNNSSSPYCPDQIENNTIVWRVSSLFHCCGGEAFETFYVVNVTDEGFGTNSIEVKAFSAQGDKIMKTDYAVIRTYHDTHPPFVDIVEPKAGLYVGGTRVLSLPKITILAGKVNIEVESTDEELGVDRVEIYIDDVLIANISEPPYIHTWSGGGFGKHVIKAVSYDIAGNHAEDSIVVWKIF